MLYISVTELVTHSHTTHSSDAEEAERFHAWSRSELSQLWDVKHSSHYYESLSLINQATENYAHFWCRPNDSVALMRLYWQTAIDFCTFHQRGLSVALSLSCSWRKQKAPETERKREYASILIKRARQTFCPLLCRECKLCRGYHFLYHRLKFIYLDGKNNRSSVRGAHKFQRHFIIHF